MTLHCQVADGKPTVSNFIWYKVGQFLIRSHVILDCYQDGVKMDDQISNTWIISGVNLFSRGNYSCRGKDQPQNANTYSTFYDEGINEAGTGSKGTLELDIMAKPTFIRNLPPKTGYLSYSDQVELICQVI